MKRIGVLYRIEANLRKGEICKFEEFRNAKCPI